MKILKQFFIIIGLTLTLIIIPITNGNQNNSKQMLTIRNLATTQLQKICSNNPLTSEDAEKILHWGHKCGYLSDREFEFYLNDDNGNKRQYALYPIFTDTQISSLFIPNISNISNNLNLEANAANCTLSSLYNRIIICTSIDQIYSYCQEYKNGKLNSYKQQIFYELITYLELPTDHQNLNCYDFVKTNSEKFSQYNPSVRDLILSGQYHRTLLRSLL